MNGSKKKAARIDSAPALSGALISGREPIRRLEIALVVATVFAGAALRVAWPARMAIEHWDEAVYASNLFTDDGYPARRLYAPPLLPAIIEWSMVAFGPNSLAAILPNLVFGILTIPLCWWAAREWFGPGAGLSAAALCAFSDFHILYTRTALTDTALCFWFLLAVYLAWRALAFVRLRDAIGAGLAIAAAWSTKYNGWLPLAVASAGLAAWVLFERVGRREGVRRLGALCALVGVAALCWSPVWCGLQSTGGYGEVARNHARYFVGLSGWTASLERQVANLRHYDGWLSVGGIGLACLLPALLHWRTEYLIAGLVGTILAAGAGSSEALAVFAVVAVGLTFFDALRGRADDDAARARRLAAWLVAAWTVGLFVSIPAYTAYSRLALPWIVSAWMAASEVIGRLDRPATCAAGQGASQGAFHCLWRRGAAWSLTVLLAVLVASIRYKDRAEPVGAIPGWQSRVGRSQSVLRAVHETLRPQPPASTGSKSKDQSRGGPGPLVFVSGEPAIFFHLAALGLTAVPVAGLDFLAPGQPPVPQPAYVLAYATPDFETLVRPYLSRLELVNSIRDRPSDLVLLDAHHPSDLAGGRPRPDEVLRIYRIKP